MKPLKQQDVPEVSGGSEYPVEKEPVLIDPLPMPIPTYPVAPVTPVVEEPFTIIRL